MGFIMHISLSIKCKEITKSSIVLKLELLPDGISSSIQTKACKEITNFTIVLKLELLPDGISSSIQTKACPYT